MQSLLAKSQVLFEMQPLLARKSQVLFGMQL